MGLMKRIKAAWEVLTKKNYILHSGNEDKEEIAKTALIRDAFLLEGLFVISTERLQMIYSILYDRSVILQGFHEEGWDYYVPTVIYDCESEEDFNELREQEIK